MIQRHQDLPYHLSNTVIGYLNLLTLLASIPIIGAGLYLAHTASTTPSSTCQSALQAPLLAVGFITFLVSLPGFVGARYHVSSALWLYLAALLLLVLALLGATAFGLAVTAGGGGAQVPGRPYREYRVSQYSSWLRSHVENDKYWRPALACVASSRACREVAAWTPEDYMRRDLTPVQSGCCKPPTSCVYGDTELAVAAVQDEDCYVWRNDPTVLCYGCESCRAGVMEQLRRHCHNLTILNAVLLLVLIAVCSGGCCAFQNARRAEYEYGGGRMSKINPRWDYFWKRGRTTRSKYAKSKVVQKPRLVDSTSCNSDKDFEQEAAEQLLSHGDDGPKKSTRVIKGTALERAVELKKKLAPKGLSFVKRMTPSNVVSGFWMGLPAASCRKHLPTHDVDVVLKDEEGKTCITKYKAENTGLSGGWGGFAKRHVLKVDDALLFHLVKPEILKVYILRENEFSTADGAKLAWKEATCAKVARKEATGGGGIRSPDPKPHVFAIVKSPADFKISVGGGFLTCITDSQRETYYTLCQARNAFLHEKANPKLAGDMIVETASIAEGIMASSSASLQALAVLMKRLESLERLGMDVSFMYKRVDDLIELITTDPSPAEVDPQRYDQVKLERDRAAKHLRAVEARVSILKDALKDIDAKMEEMV